MFNDVINSAKYYWNEIPTNTSTQMMWAAGISFVIGGMVTNDIKKGMMVAGLSALATAIHGLIAPIFKSLTGGRMQLTWGEEMCRTFLAIIGAASVARACGNSSVFQKLPILACMNAFINIMNFRRANLDSTDWILIFPNFA